MNQVEREAARVRWTYWCAKLGLTSPTCIENSDSYTRPENVHSKPANAIHVCAPPQEPGNG